MKCVINEMKHQIFNFPKEWIWKENNLNSFVFPLFVGDFFGNKHATVMKVIIMAITFLQNK